MHQDKTQFWQICLVGVLAIESLAIGAIAQRPASANLQVSSISSYNATFEPPDEGEPKDTAGGANVRNVR